VALAAALAVSAAGSALHASPFVNVSILAEPAGGSSYSSTVTLAPSTTYNYVVELSLASVGTKNTQVISGLTSTKTITSLNLNTSNNNGDGLFSLGFDLFQNAANGSTDSTQVSLVNVGTLNATPVVPTSGSDNVSWSANASAKNGTSTAAARGSNDLINIFAAHAASPNTVRTGVPGETLPGNQPAGATQEIVYTGSFTTGATLGTASSTSLLRGRFDATTGNGSLHINSTSNGTSGGSTVSVTSTTEGGADPYVAFNPLTLVTPGSGGGTSSTPVVKLTSTAAGLGGNFTAGTQVLDNTLHTAGSYTATFSPSGNSDKLVVSNNPFYPIPAYATNIGGANKGNTTEYVETSFSGQASSEVYALKVRGSDGSLVSGSQLAALISDINNAVSGSGTAEDPSTLQADNLFSSQGYNVVLRFATPPSSDNFLGLDFSNYVDAAAGAPTAGSLTVSDIAAIPEPTTGAMVLSALGGFAFLARRRRSAKAE
jgi:hypothetical protein